MATKFFLAASSDWDDTDNWTGAAVPADGDDVYIEDCDQDIDTNLDQSDIALASLNIAQSYTGLIGTATAYLNIEATTVNIGYNHGTGNPVGSGRIKLDLNGDDGSTPATINILNSASNSEDNYLPPIRLIIDYDTTYVNIFKGTVGIACETDETSVVGTINTGYVSNINNDVSAYIGSGVTLTTLNHNGGKINMRCGATTVNCDAGTLTTDGNGAITNLNITNGICISNSTGTITTAIVTGGELDLLKSPKARTISTLKLDAPGKVKYDPGVVTLSAQIQPNKTTIPVIFTAS